MALDLKNAFYSAWHEAIIYYQLKIRDCNEQLGELAFSFLKNREIVSDKATIQAKCPRVPPVDHCYGWFW